MILCISNVLIVLQINLNLMGKDVCPVFLLIIGIRHLETVSNVVEVESMMHRYKAVYVN